MKYDLMASGVCLVCPLFIHTFS